MVYKNNRMYYRQVWANQYFVAFVNARTSLGLTIVQKSQLKPPKWVLKEDRSDESLQVQPMAEAEVSAKFVPTIADVGKHYIYSPPKQIPCEMILAYVNQDWFIFEDAFDPKCVRVIERLLWRLDFWKEVSANEKNSNNMLKQSSDS